MMHVTEFLISSTPNEKGEYTVKQEGNTIQLDINSYEEWEELTYNLVPDVVKVLDATEEFTGKLQNNIEGRIFRIIHRDYGCSIHLIKLTEIAQNN